MFTNPPNQRVISSYKANVYRLPVPNSITDRAIDAPPDLRAYLNVMAKLEDKLDEHDLVFLIHALKIIKELEDQNRYKTPLENAVYDELFRYWTGALQLVNVTYIILNLLYFNSTEVISSSMLRILILDSAQDNLHGYLRIHENEQFDFPMLWFSFLAAPFQPQMRNPTGLAETAKHAAANTYDFLKSNLSFFYNKVTKLIPIQHEPPADLSPVVIQRRA